ncbi:MAG: hypothetical protein HY363_02915 [Candidatus Aenigmarchaeota archaeon]|nr:hypothetical protein [Candidatus Aenigmarchaeota archaeon]
MNYGYFPVSGNWLERLFAEGSIKPPALYRLLTLHNKEEARRQFNSQKAELEAKIEFLQNAALDRPDMFESMKQEGVNGKYSAAYYIGTHSRDSKLRQLLSGIDISQYFIMLYTDFNTARTVQRVSKQGAVLEIQVPQQVKRHEKLSNIGTVYLVPEEIPTNKIYKVHAHSIEHARIILEENGASPELCSLKPNVR